MCRHFQDVRLVGIGRPLLSSSSPSRAVASSDVWVIKKSGGKCMRKKTFMMVLVTLAFAVSAWAASTETVIYNFNNYSGDGYYPYSALVADKSGNLYGTTYQGGANNLGSVFELTLSGGVWTETLLYSFAGDATGDGANPAYSPLVFDKAGNLYGTTAYGGSTSCNCGTVFELAKSGSTWKETVLHAFLGSSQKDGYLPQAGLSLDTAGNLFGTTYHGGHAYNAGTVYRLFKARNVWVAQNVFYFLEGGDGIYPESSLTMDAKGNMYGTTYYGGSGEACSGGCGTVYKLTLGKNNKYTQSVIYSFQAGVKDGQNPYYGAGVTLDAKGNLYGTTYYGGSTENAGTVYELKVSGNSYKESLLWSFDTVSGDGYYPRGGVILVNGNIFGTTASGGSHGAGTAFEIKP